MSRKNEQARAVHVDEGHHRQLVGSNPACAWGERFACLGAAFIAIIQRGFVAMVAVGDDELLLPHLVPNQLYDPRIGNPPDPVENTVFVTHFHNWRSRRGQNVFNFCGGVAVEHKNLTEVGAGGPE